MVTNKKHFEIINHLKEEISNLKKQLDNNIYLKDILEKLTDNTNNLGSLMIGLANPDLQEKFLNISDGDKTMSITVDNRTSKPLFKEDSVKLITVYSNGNTKIQYTHKNNLSELENEELKKRGFIVI